MNDDLIDVNVHFSDATRSVFLNHTPAELQQLATAIEERLTQHAREQSERRRKMYVDIRKHLREGNRILAIKELRNGMLHNYQGDCKLSLLASKDIIECMDDMLRTLS